MKDLVNTLDNNIDKLESLLPKPNRLDEIRAEQKRAVGHKSKSFQNSWIVARLIAEIEAMEIEHRDRIQDNLDAQATVIEAYEEIIEEKDGQIEKLKNQIR